MKKTRIDRINTYIEKEKWNILWFTLATACIVLAVINL